MRLPELVGSPLSINALREDLQVSHKTASGWIAILERLYAVFRLTPFGAPRIRAVKKEQKHYHFENLVASHLLKWVHFEQDTQGREVDFVVVERRKPILLVESKWGDDAIDRGLRYLKAKFPSADAWQVTATGHKDYVSPEGIRVAPAARLLAGLV